MKYIARKEIEGYVKQLESDLAYKMKRSDFEYLFESFAVDDDGEITKYVLSAYRVECAGYDDVLGEMVDYFEIEFELKSELDYGFNEAAHFM